LYRCAGRLWLQGHSARASLLCYDGKIFHCVHYLSTNARIYKVQVGVCKNVVRRPKNTAKEANEWELLVNAGEAKGFVHSAVKFGTGLFNGKQSIDIMLLRVADMDLKSGSLAKILRD